MDRASSPNQPPKTKGGNQSRSSKQWKDWGATGWPRGSDNNWNQGQISTKSKNKTGATKTPESPSKDGHAPEGKVGKTGDTHGISKPKTSSQLVIDLNQMAYKSKTSGPRGDIYRYCEKDDAVGQNLYIAEQCYMLMFETISGPNVK